MVRACSRGTARRFSCVLRQRGRSREQGSGRARRRGGGPDACREEEARTQARRPRAPLARRASHLPALEQRQLDLIGLGLVGLGLFFAFLVYAGWDGGRGRLAGRRGPALAARRRALPGAGGARRGAARSSCCARCCPRCGRSARARSACSWRVTLGAVGRDARRRAGRRAPGLVGRGVGQDARRHGGGDARLGRRRRCSAAVGAHIVASSCSSRACCCSPARRSRA